ncbi:MAG: twin-arginine translocase TatA/TatE family subunit [Acidimicrobiia bacterium]|nr:twin-arginine translocase TatA/TatE family subunit [Acidimicrobiia bacterium]
MQLGPAEILVVLVIALLVFGPNKLPEVGRQVGRAMKEFRQFQRTMTRDVHEVFSDDASGSAEPAPTLPPKDTTIDAASSDVSSGGSSGERAADSSTGSSDERAGESAADPETHA